MPTILLIRHGQSLSNAGLPTACPRDVGLTDRGWEEAKRVAREVRQSYPALDLIITSDYRRARETAECTRRLYKSQAPDISFSTWDTVHEFTYLSSWGKIFSTVGERRKAVCHYWDQADPKYVDGPGAESFKEFARRVQSVRQRLEAKKETIAVFSHHQFICALLWLSCRNTLCIDQKTMKQFKGFLDEHPIDNGAIVRVQFEGSNHPWRYEILTSNLAKPDSHQPGVAVACAPNREEAMLLTSRK